MKFAAFRSLTRFALGLLLAPLAPAAYNPAIVSPDARWVLYLDFDGLRTSELGKELIAALEQAQSGPGGPGGGMIGINISRLLATVGNITAYGTNLTADPAALDGTLIAQGTQDLRKIAESILLQGTLAQPAAFSEVTDLPFPAYAVTDAKAPADKQMQLLFAFPPEPIVLIGKSKAQLVKARDVFRGQSPSLARKSDSPLTQFAAHARGAYLFAASVVPTEPLFPEKAPQARILELAKSGSISLGERGADLFAHAELSASSQRNAEKLLKILEGLTAMLSLAESNDQQLAEFLNSSKVSRNGDVVTLQVGYPAARLVQMTQNLRAQAEVRPSPKAPSISQGKVIAEWSAADPAPSEEGLSWHTIDGVALGNGNLVTLGRALNGGRDARFDRVEVVPAGGGAPLVFHRGFMRTVRGSLLQFPFPGTEGTYTLKVGYVADPEGKAKFAVSVHDPKAARAPAGRTPGPGASGSKSK